MTIGEHVQEGIDCTDRGLYKMAFVSACAAVTETLKKVAGSDGLSEDDLKRFIKENWDLVLFMCLPRALPLALNVPWGIKRIDPKFNVHYGAEEIVLMVMQKTIALGRLPDEFDFHAGPSFEVKDGKLLIPHTLVGGLLGLAVVHPINEDEEIGDKYWINISDFKMFVSELWGRIDLAQRVRRFYLERD
ncbi:MAG: hypothetical protein R2747_14775 [Pyrinomonadaceae bacterium]